MTGIFLRQGGKLTAMREAAYDQDTLLQGLIAEHPEVLAGDGSGGPASAWLLRDGVQADHRGERAGRLG